MVGGGREFSKFRGSVLGGTLAVNEKGGPAGTGRALVLVVHSFLNSRALTLLCTQSKFLATYRVRWRHAAAAYVRARRRGNGAIPLAVREELNAAR